MTLPHQLRRAEDTAQLSISYRRLWLVTAEVLLATCLSILPVENVTSVASAQAADTDQTAGPSDAQLAAEAAVRSAQEAPAQPAPDDDSPAPSQNDPEQPPRAGASGGGMCLFGICGDLGQWLQEQVQSILATIVRDGVARPLSDFLGNIFNTVNFITRTPEDLTFRNAQVQQFTSIARAVANVLLAVVAMVGGFNIMFRPYFGSAYHTAMELVPRFVLGGILVNTANWWCAFAIQANNTLCGLFGFEGTAAIVRSMTDAIGSSLVGGPIAAFPLLIAVAIYVVMFLLLVVQQVMRLGLIDVLLVLSPLAAICWVLPQTHGWGRLWGSVFLGTVFAQFVQVLTLVLGVNLMTASWLTSALANGPAAALLQPLLGIGIVWLTLKIPNLMRGGAAGGNFAGSLVGTAAGAAIGMGVRAAIGGGAGGARAAAGGASRAASGAVASRS